MTSASAFRSGHVMLLGRPNAGKSTLMNQLLREKVAIVSDKPQTTRSRIVGVLTEDRGQLVFLDTPGVHKPQHRMNRRMIRAVNDTVLEADLVVLVVDASAGRRGTDERLLEIVRASEKPAVLALNKVDEVAKPKLLPMMAAWHETGVFSDVVPLSALTGEGCDTLLGLLFDGVPEGPPTFEEDLLTPHSERFLAAERIREKLLGLLREELPFASAVVVDQWEDPDEPDQQVRIAATILVEREGQKRIVVGRGGDMIKRIGTLARQDLVDFLGSRVHLDLHVKVEPSWRENARRLGELENEARSLI